jgi:DEAD/DEAH box helicase domain-containing protein
VYLRLPPGARTACQAANIPFREGVHAAAHALLNVVPLFLVCNPSDMATECDNPYDTRYRPERLLLFDKQPGGIGLAAQVRGNTGTS